jgi:hypothetical protein
VLRGREQLRRGVHRVSPLRAPLTDLVVRSQEPIQCHAQKLREISFGRR